MKTCFCNRLASSLSGRMFVNSSLNTAQQLGGSIGTALLNTIAAGAAAGFGAAGIAALVHGYSAAAGFGAAILVAASVVAAVMIDAGRPVTRQAGLAPGGTSR